MFLKKESARYAGANFTSSPTETQIRRMLQRTERSTKVNFLFRQDIHH
jgi:hypothetical protein